MDSSIDKTNMTRDQKKAYVLEKIDETEKITIERLVAKHGEAYRNWITREVKEALGGAKTRVQAL